MAKKIALVGNNTDIIQFREDIQVNDDIFEKHFHWVRSIGDIAGREFEAVVFLRKFHTINSYRDIMLEINLRRNQSPIDDELMFLDNVIGYAQRYMGLSFYFYDFDDYWYSNSVLGNYKVESEKKEVKPPPLFDKCKSYVERHRDYTDVIFTGIDKHFYITFEAKNETGKKINGRFSKNIFGNPIIHID